MRRRVWLWAWLVGLFLTLAFAGEVAAQERGRGESFHAVSGNAFADVSSEAIAMEGELEWRPGHSPHSIGLLAGAFGNPMQQGLFGAALMFTSHFRFSRVEGYARAGLVREFFHEPQTFPRAMFHVSGTGNITPSLFVEAAYQAAIWSHRSHDAFRMEIGVGPGFLVRHTHLYALLQFSVLDAFHGLGASEEHPSGWMLGPRIVAEYLFL